MAEKCSVLGCASESASDADLKLYRYPADGYLLEQWKSVLRCSYHRSRDRVCNLHFSDSDFLLTNLGWRVLAPGAVPSLNLPSWKLEADEREIPSNEDHQSPESSSVKSLPSGPSSPNEEQRFRCPYCEEIFMDSRILLLHLPFHKPGLLATRKKGILGPSRYKLPCSKCGKIFWDKVKYWKHLKLVCQHNRFGSNCLTAHNFFCGLCGSSFDCRRRLRDHSKAFHPSVNSGRFTTRCIVCDRDLGSRSELRSHAKTHLKIPVKFFCDVCNRLFFSLTELGIHLDWHGFESECPECCAQLDDVRGLALHLKTHTPEAFYSCDFCPLVFGTLASVKAHLQLHDLTSDVAVKCQLCEETTASTVVFVGTYFHKHKFYEDPGSASTSAQTCTRKKCDTEDTDRSPVGSRSEILSHGKGTYSEESRTQYEIHSGVDDPVCAEMFDTPQFLGVKGDASASLKPITIKMEVADDAIW